MIAAIIMWCSMPNVTRQISVVSDGKHIRHVIDNTSGEDLSCRLHVRYGARLYRSWRDKRPCRIALYEYDADGRIRVMSGEMVQSVEWVDVTAWNNKVGSHA